MTTTTLIDDRLRAFCFRYDPSAPLEAETTILAEEGGVRTTRFVISSTHGQRVPGLIWAPLQADRPLPAVLLQHGATSRKEDDYIRLTALRWSREGLLCVAIDASDHGERTRAQSDPQAIWTLPWTRRDHAIQMCVDLQRTVDYLESRDDVDVSRLGYVGFSMGTICGVPFVALDPRVKAAAFAVGGARLNEFQQPPADPRVREELALASAIVDPVHFAPLISPRPVLLVNGSRDELVPVSAARALFDALGEPKRIVWYDGGHTEMRGQEFKAIHAFLGEHLPDAQV
jgi:dienelactone hydrolase